jgi:hypothetical protein
MLAVKAMSSPIAVKNSRIDKKILLAITIDSEMAVQKIPKDEISSSEAELVDRFRNRPLFFPTTMW